jgi:decaprenylphospho-beta-D-erythro-pentofuranosid-2-ulose 2-reductase
MSFLLIIGAKSDIAKAVARKYAANGYDLYLAARKSHELDEFATDIAVRTQRKVRCMELDILDYASHSNFYESLPEKPFGVITAVGYLGDQKKAQSSFSEAKRIINTNYTGLVSLLNIVADDFERRKTGFIIGISSVAGDRGRASNYVYGSAKAGFTAYLSGLRKMTAGMNLPARLTAQPEEIAEDIWQAQQKGKYVLYTKWMWKWVMLVVTNIPEWKFKGMRI